VLGEQGIVVVLAYVGPVVGRARRRPNRERRELLSAGGTDGLLVEDVALEKDRWAAVGEVDEALGFDGEHCPDFGGSGADYLHGLLESEMGVASPTKSGMLRRVGQGEREKGAGAVTGAVATRPPLPYGRGSD
jgi:hypothetical protein